MQAAITTEALRRSFAGTEAVRDVDLEVPQGSIYAFVGPNGAGKTTTIRMLTGLLRPTSGSIRIFDLPMPEQRFEIARLLGALVETQSLYDHLTGHENLDISRRLLGLPRTAIEEVLEIVDLTTAAKRRVGGYSLGMRQRLVLARALLGRPRLLILDEPANGLDPDGIRDLRALLRSLADSAGVTIFVSSHQLQELELVATHVGLMHSGRLVAQGPMAELLSGRTRRLQLIVDRPAEVAAFLERGGLRVARSGDRLIAEWPDGEGEPNAILADLLNQGVRLSELRLGPASLEDMYVNLTRSAA